MRCRFACLSPSPLYETYRSANIPKTRSSQSGSQYDSHNYAIEPDHVACTIIQIWELTVARLESYVGASDLFTHAFTKLLIQSTYWHERVTQSIIQMWIVL